MRALNARLPEDIRVRAIEPAFAGFDARHDAVRKTYRYLIWNGAAPSPFLRRVAWHVMQPLDAVAMTAAATALPGAHDFAAFQGAGADTKTTMRRLLKSDVRTVALSDDDPWSVPTLADDLQDAAARLLRYEVTGTGFLRHMVRAIVGTLVDIGRGRRSVDAMTAILESRDRRRAGETAPAHGLMLWRVEYGTGPRLEKPSTSTSVVDTPTQ